MVGYLAQVEAGLTMNISGSTVIDGRSMDVLVVETCTR